MKMVAKGKLQARTQTESIGKILDDLESEYLTRENVLSVQLSRDNMKQVLHLERVKIWPRIPKTLDEYDSADGKACLKSGGNYWSHIIKILS